jgi:hypothetical protein
VNANASNKSRNDLELAVCSEIDTYADKSTAHNAISHAEHDVQAIAFRMGDAGSGVFLGNWQ